MVRSKTRLFQDPEEIKSACSFMRYCINVCLPIHVIRNVNTKQFKVIYTFYKDSRYQNHQKEVEVAALQEGPGSFPWSLYNLSSFCYW